MRIILKLNCIFMIGDKVGILTFHASHNCGSMLQAFALQQFLCAKGYEAEIIDFCNKASKQMYGLLPHVDLSKGLRGSGLKRWIESLPYIGVLHNHREAYLSFCNDYLKKTNRHYSSLRQLDDIKGYASVIAGSDQIWNISCYDADEAYFLPFVGNTKRIAYAVSLGSTIIQEKAQDINLYKNLVTSFDSISVREINAIKQIQDLGARDVKLTLDPTLLLTQQDWEDRIDIGDPLIAGDYIFYYAFHYKTNINRKICEIGRKYNMPVYIIDAKAWGPGGARNDGLYISKEYGPRAFLNLMKYARLCFTTSFHGTVFSVVFRKTFWFLESEMHNQNDDRVSTLTSLLNIKDRQVDYSLLHDIEVLGPVDYNKVSLRLAPLVADSTEFLQKALG